MSEFGTLLRHWRQTRRFSQLELGLEAEVSSRHISFLETGRANPSREMITTLAGILDVPMQERNVLMQSAGFANQYSQFDLAQPTMAPVREALRFILDSHEPYPASVFSRNWDMLMSNQAHHRVFDQLKALQPNLPDTNNIVELLFDPNGMKPFIENWEQVASLFLQRLRREKMVYQQTNSDLLDRVLKMDGIPPSWQSFELSGDSQPMVSIQLNVGGHRLSMFSALSSFGTAIDVTTNELVMEQFFPTDEATKRYFEQAAASASQAIPQIGS